MRIIAGSAKGRRLDGPKGSSTRPMTGRAREALFSSLGRVVVGARVLDLFAGSGALGLEALSRGARRAVFVEIDRAALVALRHNIEATGLSGTVVRSDVGEWLETRQEPAFDLVFVDPPYSLSLASVTDLIHQLVTIVADGATIVVHRRFGDDPPAPAGLELVDRRRYGDTELFRYQKEDVDVEDTQ